MEEQERTEEPVWRKIGCDERNEIYRSSLPLAVGATLTDLAGRFGEPEISTEWLVGESPILRDHRWPGGDGGHPDARPCEHYTTLPATQETPDE